MPILLIMLLFTGCEVKEYTPEIPMSFTQKAKVMSGDFSFECEICKTENEVKTTVSSTAASGMVMTYDGEVLNFNYREYSYDIDGAGFERSNISIVNVKNIVTHVISTPVLLIIKPHNSSCDSPNDVKHCFVIVNSHTHILQFIFSRYAKSKITPSPVKTSKPITGLKISIDLFPTFFIKTTAITPLLNY